MSDGRFSSKPIRSGRSYDGVASTDGEFSTEATAPAAAKAFLNSPAVRREIDAVLKEPFPDVGPPQCAPLAKKTPRGATDLGRPMASAVLVQEYLIGLIFLRICGWIFIFFGGLIVLVSIGMCIGGGGGGNADKNRNDLIMVPTVGAMGLGIAGAGLWFGLLRGRVITQMCWFCPHGMVWRTDHAFEWYAWEEVPEVYCSSQGSRPAIGIRFDGEVSWISFSNTRVSRLIVDYIENRASAAGIEANLRALADGKGISFGTWRLRRSSLQGTTDGVEWRHVVELERDDRDLILHHGVNSQITIYLDEIPYPSMFTALARAAHVHAHEHKI